MHVKDLDPNDQAIIAKVEGFSFEFDPPVAWKMPTTGQALLISDVSFISDESYGDTIVANATLASFYATLASFYKARNNPPDRVWELAEIAHAGNVLDLVKRVEGWEQEQIDARERRVEAFHKEASETENFYKSEAIF